MQQQQKKTQKTKQRHHEIYTLLCTEGSDMVRALIISSAHTVCI